MCSANGNPERVKYYSRGANPRPNDVKMKNPERVTQQRFLYRPFRA